MLNYQLVSKFSPKSLGYFLNFFSIQRKISDIILYYNLKILYCWLTGDQLYSAVPNPQEAENEGAGLGVVGSDLPSQGGTQYHSFSFR